MLIAEKLKGTSVFVGCGFAAKYLLGGGNFAVPLQWMLGLRRLGIDAIWLEHFPATEDAASDAAHIQAFAEQLDQHGLRGRYCLLYHRCPGDAQSLEAMEAHGLPMADLLQRLARPNILLNLCNSIHSPLLDRFERRVFCDLDPGEISYWMAQMEMGQSRHDEFWTIGLNLNGKDYCGPEGGVPWKTFCPLVDTVLYQPQPRPAQPRFSTVTQWYWKALMEVKGEYLDFSKQTAFQPYMPLPSRVPEAEMELAANLNADDPEIERIRSFGWKLTHPHVVAPNAAEYRRYLAGSLAEFSPGKGFHALWRTGWISDRSVAYLAMGRPVITDDNGAARYLPEDSGMIFVSSLPQAEEAVRRVLKDWDRLSARARMTAVEYFDSARVLERLLTALV